MSSRVLIVDDDAAIARTLRHSLGSIAYMDSALSIAEAQQLLSVRATYNALIVDLKLPDGSGLELLAWARARRCSASALLLTGMPDNDVVNRAFDLDAQYVLKPVDLERIRRFLHGVSSMRPPPMVEPEPFAERYELTKAEQRILEAAVEGHSRSEICAAFGLTTVGLKSHVRNILAKTGDGSLLAVVNRALRERRSPLGR
jgi:DNA-binding NarL/FixJ family response regulator